MNKLVPEYIRTYLDKRILLLLNTHYNIALIYNEDRKEGLRLAEEFRSSLKEKNEYYYNASKKRYKYTVPSSSYPSGGSNAI